MNSILIGALLAVLPGYVNADFLSGNDLVKGMYEAGRARANDSQINYYEIGKYLGFVVGVFDAYDAAGLICPGGGVTQGQAMEIVSTYIKSNPTKWNSSAVALVHSALKAAFPCR